MNERTRDRKKEWEIEHQAAKIVAVLKYIPMNIDYRANPLNRYYCTILYTKCTIEENCRHYFRIE